MNLISDSVNPSPTFRQKKEQKNFQQSFTPTPKGSLLEILLTGLKEIFIPTYKAKQRENKKISSSLFTPAPKGSLLEILQTE